jgi:hypothetical protein
MLLTLNSGHSYVVVSPQEIVNFLHLVAFGELPPLSHGSPDHCPTWAVCCGCDSEIV